MNEISLHICPKCKNEFSGNFCNNCGLKVATSEVNFKNFFKTIIKSIFEVDRGFLYTLFALLKRPEQVIRAYNSGQTGIYTNPAKLIIIISGVYSFVALYFGLFDFDKSFITHLNPSEEFTEGFTKSFTKGANMVKNYMNIFMLLNVPLVSIGTWIGFRKWKQNYTQHLVLNAYIISITTLITMIVLAGTQFTEINIVYRAIFNQLITLIFMTFVFSRYFEIGIFKAFLRYILTILVLMVCTMIISGVVGFIWGFYFATFGS